MRAVSGNASDTRLPIWYMSKERKKERGHTHYTRAHKFQFFPNSGWLPPILLVPLSFHHVCVCPFLRATQHGTVLHEIATGALLGEPGLTSCRFEMFIGLHIDDIDQILTMFHEILIRILVVGV